MTPEESKLLNRIQLISIIRELGDRAQETGEENLAIMLYGIAGAAAEGSEEVLAILIGEFARLRMKKLGVLPPEEENQS